MSCCVSCRDLSESILRFICVFMLISCLCTCMHLPPCVLKKSLLFASPQHACSAASSRLCFRLCSSGRVRTRNWCVHLCAHLSLSLPLSLSTCEYIPALTYTRTHIRTSKVAYKHAGTHVYIASTAPSAPGASTRGFQHTATAHASGLHRRVAACIACYCEPARVLAEPRATI